MLSILSPKIKPSLIKNTDKTTYVGTAIPTAAWSCQRRCRNIPGISCRCGPYRTCSHWNKTPKVLLSQSGCLWILRKIPPSRDWQTPAPYIPLPQRRKNTQQGRLFCPFLSLVREFQSGVISRFRSPHFRTQTSVTLDNARLESRSYHLVGSVYFLAGGFRFHNVAQLSVWKRFPISRLSQTAWLELFVLPFVCCFLWVFFGGGEGGSSFSGSSLLS